MLHSLRTRPRETPTDEPADFLLACHARMRQFAATAIALATRADLDRKQIDEACDELLRYFRVALPLHEADEEVTLAPALSSLAMDAEPLERMRKQHVAIHEILDALIPLWESRKREASAAHARKLAAMLDEHLTLEETVIFPRVAQLPALDRKRLFEEMRSRRTF